MSDNNSAEERLVRLESLAMHLQHDFETLNGVVLEQRAILERLERALNRLDSRLATLGEVEETRDPLSERPPHY